MRLFLHGRLASAMLRTKLEQASTTTTTTTLPPITTLLLSSWNFDAVDEDILDLLIQYVQSRQPHELEEVTLHNCQGDEQQQKVVAAIVRSSPRCFTIRHDEQQTELSTFVANGMVQGASCGGGSSSNSRLGGFQLRGVTLTPSVVESLRLALSQSPDFHSLSIKSHFTLPELDRKQVSILGRHAFQDLDDVIYEMIRLMQDLRFLTCLDLENCHIPDPYLAEILRAAHKNRLATLSLRGNMAQLETMTVLSEWMISNDCPLKHLDLSWQRLVGSKSNHSPFASQMPFLASTIRFNTSLKTLLISENQLQDADMRLLCQALTQNSTLTSLDLKDCRITMDGFHLLAKSLPKLRLQRLNLNGIQQAQGSKLKSLFFKSLLHNVYMLDLVLPFVESKRLAWLLEWNKAGRRVLVSRPELPPSLWPQLLERADQVGKRASDREPVRHSASAIYYLLREKGFHTISKSRDREQAAAAAPAPSPPPPPTDFSLSATISKSSSWQFSGGIITPPSSPRRDNGSTLRISPDSSFEDDYTSRSRTFTSSPVARAPAPAPAPAPPSPQQRHQRGRPMIRHLARVSGEIELRLESTSSFDKSEVATTMTLKPTTSSSQPSPFLARPRLMANRTTTSSSIMSHNNDNDPLLSSYMKTMSSNNNNNRPRPRMPLAPVY